MHKCSEFYGICHLYRIEKMGGNRKDAIRQLASFFQMSEKWRWSAGNLPGLLLATWKVTEYL